MDEELRWVSMGFDPTVMTCQKYDVNGYRFHTSLIEIIGWMSLIGSVKWVIGKCEILLSP